MRVVCALVVLMLLLFVTSFLHF